ncbi:hypothetical protein [Patulibacter sp. SYSU D01012]|uniref:hypothetical protein n=1 Tax=Patulibacter sp. SYSU D01012 TaxID=2817381 RepID=UPI001B317860|nr:hypothetical protein [Patulibacter sp. SYSU D01012]
MSTPPTTAAIPLRSAVVAGLAGPVLALALGVGVVAAAATSPYAGDHGFVAPISAAPVR